MHGAAHLRAIPLLATPAVTLCINEAGARAAAAFVVLHGPYLVVRLVGSPDFGGFARYVSGLWDLGDARALPPVGEAPAVPVDWFKQVLGWAWPHR